MDETSSDSPPATQKLRRRDVPEAYREITHAAYLGLVINLLLGAIKFVGGIWGRSFALIADAINSLGDVVSTLIVLAALRVAQRPADDEHPYGHSRAEAIAASNVALLIVLSGMGIAWEAFRRLRVMHDIPPSWTLWIAGANVVLKEILYRYKLWVGKRTGSAAIVANAWDHRSDALCALAVLLGLLCVRIGGKSWISADEIASIVVALAIIGSGIHLFFLGCSELMDVQADPKIVEQIRKLALDVPQVLDVETLWVRKSGIEYFVDIHVQVDPELSVAAGHHIGHEVKDKLLQANPQLRDVLVHLEPYHLG